MQDRFTISVDRRRGMVKIVMNGFFTADDIEDFLEARREAHASLGWPRYRHLTMNDVREMKIQAQEVVERFQNLLADPEYRSRRLAFIVGPTLARLQLERALAGRDDARCFEDPAEAEAWLFEEAWAALRGIA